MDSFLLILGILTLVLSFRSFAYSFSSKSDELSKTFHIFCGWFAFVASFICLNSYFKIF